jgi:hypothetical protein
MTTTIVPVTGEAAYVGVPSENWFDQNFIKLRIVAWEVPLDGSSPVPITVNGPITPNSEWILCDGDQLLLMPEGRSLTYSDARDLLRGPYMDALNRARGK